MDEDDFIDGRFAKLDDARGEELLTAELVGRLIEEIFEARGYGKVDRGEGAEEDLSVGLDPI